MQHVTCIYGVFFCLPYLHGTYLSTLEFFFWGGMGERWEIRTEAETETDRDGQKKGYN